MAGGSSDRACRVGHGIGASIIPRGTGSDIVTSVDPASYRALFDRSGEAMVILRGGRIADANSAARDLLGLCKEGLPTAVLGDLFADENVRGAFDRQLDENGSVVGFEARIRTRGGLDMDCQLTASVLRARDGADEVQAIISRPTESVRPDDSPRSPGEGGDRQAQGPPSMRKNPVDSKAINPEFLPHVFHELRTPLNGILGFAHLLKEPAFGDLSSRQQRFADNILASGTQLHELINDVGDLWRAEAGLLELDLAPMDVRSCVESCVAALEAKNSEAVVSLDVELPEGFMIQGDERRIRQAVSNLLDAALVLAGADEPLAVSLSMADDELRLTAHNVGAGIRPEYWKSIGALFVGGYSEEAKRFGRPGLRLPLVKKLVELHGGSVSAGGDGGERSLTIVLLVYPNTRTVRGPDTDSH